MAAEADVLELPRGRSVWMVSRKHPPAIGGMEILSARIVEEVGRLAPLTTIAKSVTPLGLLWFLPVSAGRLLAGLIAGRVAVLHLHDPVLSPLGWLARPFGVPVVVTLHGLDVCYPSPVYQAYFRSFARSFAAYVCISRHVVALAEAAGIAPERLSVVPVGIASDRRPEELDARELGAGPASKAVDRSMHAIRHSDMGDRDCELARAPWTDATSLIVTVGRLVPRKGVRWFVAEVFPTLAQRFPGLHYAVAGSGPEESSIREAVALRGLTGRVHLLGEVSDGWKSRLLVRASVVAMPNVRVPGDCEGFGIAALEAARAGRALVASDLEGLRDSVIACRTGVRVAPGDATAWIDAITHLLARPTLAEALGRRARRGVTTHFGWPSIARRYCEIFRSVLERGA
jgi:phosphatidylinositol alpha-1,6-mannosyltransferase